MKIVGLNSIRTILKATSIGKNEIIFSAIFAFILVLGYVLSTNDTSTNAYKIFVYLSGALIIWAATLFGMTIIKQKSLHSPKRIQTIFLKHFSDKKLWLLTSLLIFICYLPVILTCFSVLTIDSWSSIGQITGKAPLTSAHPIIFTAFTSIFIHLGLLFGSLELGTVFYSFAQSAILAMIFAYIIVWMRREGIGKNGIIATFLFYAILPINAFAGIVMWKDILFAGFGLLLLVMLRQLYLLKDRFFTPQRVTCFVLLAFLFCTWRNNGFYAYLAFSVIAVTVNCRMFINKKYLSVLLAPILLFAAYSTLSTLVAGPPSSSEAMSVPLQQIARTVKYHSDSISKEDKATIDEILPFEKLSELYNPGLSDPIKSSFNKKTYNENKGKYISLWFKLFREHKKTYVAAFLYNTYGYVYPFKTSPTTTDTLVNNANQLNTPEGYRDNAYQHHGKGAATKYRDLIMGVVPLLHNIGFYTCVILLGVYIAVVKKKRELIGVFILLLCLFFTTILGPVNGEFRYLYLFVIAMPFITASVSIDRARVK